MQTVSGSDADPRCPECGEPIGMTATYCMHCSADLTAERERADTDDDGDWSGASDAPNDGWDGTAEQTDGDGWGGAADPVGSSGTGTAGDDGQLLDPDGIVDDTLTVVVGIAGGVVVGIVATIELAFLGGGRLAPVGFLAWLLSTIHLARQRTVQGAVSRAAYGVAVVLLLVPLIALSPAVEADVGGRAVGFVVLLVTAGVPAAVAAAVGYVAGRYVPDEGGDGGESGV
ncbi:zinc ribbon domain-containing protein [Halobacteriales archaeon QS_1_68_17]|nr:MAG: zinc ribbon domain-containing protein [Halobacteriales archaeon QS_1_68_17]